MCPPAVILAVMAVASIAMQAVATHKANNAAKKQIAAIAEQQDVKRKAEIRSYGVDAASKLQAARKASSQNRALLAALGISGVEGTAPTVIGAPKAAFEVQDVFQREALENRVFAIDATASNQINDIRFKRSAANFQFLANSVMTAGKAASGFAGGGGAAAGFNSATGFQSGYGSSGAIVSSSTGMMGGGV